MLIHEWWATDVYPRYVYEKMCNDVYHSGLADTLPPVLGYHCASWFGGNISQQSQYYINIGVSLCVKSTICIDLCWINIHRAHRKGISSKSQILRLQFKINTRCPYWYQCCQLRIPWTPVLLKKITGEPVEGCLNIRAKLPI